MNKKALPTVEYLNELFEIIDNELYWKINKFRSNSKKGDKVGCLNSNGYLRVRINQVEYLIHNIIWKMTMGSDPIYNLDHINRIKTDNRIENLRDVTPKINCRNVDKFKNNTSGYSNINIRNNKNGISYIVRFGTQKYSKSFSSLEDAIQHRNKKYIEYEYYPNINK